MQFRLRFFSCVEISPASGNEAGFANDSMDCEGLEGAEAMYGFPFAAVRSVSERPSGSWEIQFVMTSESRSLQMLILDVGCLTLVRVRVAA